ncbi:thioredoxin [Pseudoruegeria sp. M32A2M]|nr:thioredoxin [Pseudoruegeria sp. M32A2M]
MKRILGALAALMLAAPMALAEIGEDGLHKADWMRDTFKDLSEDLDEANAEGKRLMLIFEQRGCIYCKQMHEEVFPRPEIASYIEENYFVVQMNLFGDVEVTDFDGDTRTEKQMARKWGIMFTPTILFLPEEVGDDATAPQAAVAMMPGAFKGGTTLDMLTWVREKLYDAEGEDAEFQRYHARKIEERAAQK